MIDDTIGTVIPVVGDDVTRLGASSSIVAPRQLCDRRHSGVVDEVVLQVVCAGCCPGLREIWLLGGERGNIGSPIGGFRQTSRPQCLRDEPGAVVKVARVGMHVVVRPLDGRRAVVVLQRGGRLQLRCRSAALPRHRFVAASVDVAVVDPTVVVPLELVPEVGGPIRTLDLAAVGVALQGDGGTALLL